MLLLPACDAPDSLSKDSGGIDSNPWTYVESQPDSPAETDSPPDSGGGDSDSPADSDSGGDSGPVDTDPPDTDTDTGSGSAGPPRVILFIGDGMGFEHVAAASLYQSGTRGLSFMESLPVQGRLRTASFSGITDSAAGATAMATGAKTYNGRLGLDRDGLQVESLVELARDRGMATGVVTTDELVGATPSAFVVHVEDRGDEDEIASAWVGALPDLAFGGGYLVFEELLPEVDAQVVTDADGLAAAVPDGRPVLGLFADATFPYVSEGYDTQPDLATMTEAALAWLDSDPDGFFLVVEGARIDHASHGNRGESVHLEADALDQAVSAASAWASTRSDVTLLVTADHECGGLGVPETGDVGEAPEATWRWGSHTNADVPVFASAGIADVLDGERVDNTWIHEVLVAAVTGGSFAEPEVPRLADGWTEDLGAAWTTQAWDSELAGYVQLDGLRLAADGDGLWIGLDGVFQRDEQALVLLVDLDWGAGTGFGGDTVPVDTDGDAEALLAAFSLGAPEGFGADLALVSIGAMELLPDDPDDASGLLGLSGDLGSAEDLGDFDGVALFDDGNVADGEAAADAGSTGSTEGGLEVWMPWDEILGGPPAGGLSGAVAAIYLSTDGSAVLDQALPSWSGEDPEAAELDSLLLFEVDSSGALVGSPRVGP